MKKLVAAAALGTTLLGASPTPAHASAAVDAALALGAFAVFNQLFLAPFWARPVYAAPAPVTYTTPEYAPGPATYSSGSPRPRWSIARSCTRTGATSSRATA